MDRRTLLTSIASVAACGACTAKDRATQSEVRPTLAIESEGPGRWRVRSWQWQANAWRPLIARVRQVSGRIEVSGPIDPADRAEVVARLGA